MCYSTAHVVKCQEFKIYVVYKLHLFFPISFGEKLKPLGILNILRKSVQDHRRSRCSGCPELLPSHGWKAEALPGSGRSSPGGGALQSALVGMAAGGSRVHVGTCCMDTQQSLPRCLCAAGKSLFCLGLLELSSVPWAVVSSGSLHRARHANPENFWSVPLCEPGRTPWCTDFRARCFLVRCLEEV